MYNLHIIQYLKQGSICGLKERDYAEHDYQYKPEQTPPNSLALPFY